MFSRIISFIKNNKKLVIVNILALTIVSILSFEICALFNLSNTLSYDEKKINNTIGTVNMQLDFQDVSKTTAKMVIDDRLKMLSYAYSNSPDLLEGMIDEFNKESEEFTYYVLNNDCSNYYSNREDFLDVSECTEMLDKANCDGKIHSMSIDRDEYQLSAEYVYIENHYFVGLTGSLVINMSLPSTWEDLFSYSRTDANVFFGAYDNLNNRVIYSQIDSIYDDSLHVSFDGYNTIYDKTGEKFTVKFYPYNDEISIFTVMPYSLVKNTTKSSSIFLFVIYLGALIVFNIFILSISKGKTDPVKIKKYGKKYYDKTMLTKAYSLSLILIIVLYVISSYLMVMRERVRISYNHNNETGCLVDLDNEYNSYIKYYKETINNYQLNKAKNIQKTLQSHTSLHNKKNLISIEKNYDVNSISIYDLNGNVIATGSGYDNYTLPNNESVNSETYKLWEVLKGADYVVTESYVSPQGNTVFSIGTRLADDQGKTCGMVEIGFKADQYSAQYLSFDINDYLKYFMNNGVDDIITIDKKDLSITHFSRNNMIGKTFEDLGLADNILQDRYNGFIQTSNGNSFINVAVSDADYILVFSNYKMNSMLLFIMMLISNLLLLPVYPIINSIVLGKKDINEFILTTDNTVDDLATIRSKNLLLRTICVFIYIFTAFFVLLFLCSDHLPQDSSIVWYLSHQNWDKSFNAFAVLSSIIFIAILFSLESILILLFKLVEKLGDSRSISLSQLFISITKYVCVLVGFYYVAMNLGFDSRAIFASLGIFSMAIGFGSKDVINDMVAGISSILEKNYRVGDVVSFHGETYIIKTIGIRTTILDIDGKQKIVNNTQMTGIENLTESREILSCEIPFNTKYSISDIEEFFNHELPTVAANLAAKNIKCSPPVYAGISKFGSLNTTVKVISTCPPLAYSETMPEFLREMKLMLDRNDIVLPQQEVGSAMPKR